MLLRRGCNQAKLDRTARSCGVRWYQQADQCCVAPGYPAITTGQRQSHVGMRVARSRCTHVQAALQSSVLRRTRKPTLWRQGAAHTLTGGLGSHEYCIRFAEGCSRALQRAVGMCYASLLSPDAQCCLCTSGSESEGQPKGCAAQLMQKTWWYCRKYQWHRPSILAH